MLQAAEWASVVGDQMSKVGLAMLIFARTGSALWTTVAYALSMLPDLVAGPLLAPLADRFPRRTVMVVSAVVQCGLVLVILVPGIDLGWQLAAVAFIAVCTAPFKAAQAASVPDVLVEVEAADRAQTRLTLIRELGQLAGLGLAAGAVGLIGVTAALAIDAASFALAAVLLRFGLRQRPAAAPIQRVPLQSEPRPARLTGWRVLRGDRRLLTLTVLLALTTAAVVPEAVMVPWAAQMQAPGWMVALLLAADPAGMVVATAVLERLPMARRRTLIGPLALLAVAPLVAFAVAPSLVVACVLLFLSGAGAAFLGPTRGAVAEIAPPQVRGAVFGLLRTVVRAGQGLGAAAAGLITDWSGSAGLTIAGAGVVGLAVAIPGALAWHHVYPETSMSPHTQPDQNSRSIPTPPATTDPNGVTQ